MSLSVPSAGALVLRREVMPDAVAMAVWAIRPWYQRAVLWILGRAP